MPLPEELNLEGFEGSREDLDRLLEIDLERWSQEIALREEHLSQFEGLPEEIWQAHRRVSAAVAVAREGEETSLV